MNTPETMAARRRVAPEHALTEAESPTCWRDGWNPGWMRRALSAATRWVWAEPLSTESPTPFIDAHPRRWPDGAPSRW
jgi:hypothetical protein